MAGLHNLFLQIVRQSAKVTFEKVLQLHLIFRSSKSYLNSRILDALVSGLCNHKFVNDKVPLMIV